MRRTTAMAAIMVCLGLLWIAGCGGDKGPAPTGEKITLKLNMEKGTKKTAEMDMEMNMDIKVGGKKQQMKMGFGVEMTFDVQDVDSEGMHTVLVTYDRVTMNMTAPGPGVPPIEFDSKTGKGSDNPASAPLAAMVGHPLAFIFRPNASVAEVSGYDEMIDNMAASMPGMSREQFRKQMENQKDSMGQMMASFPDKPVDLRDTWNQKMSMESSPGMMMNMDITYTLYDRKDGEAIIKAKGKIKTSGQMSLSGDLNGTLYVDEKTGWTKRTDMTMNIKGGQTVQGQKLDMDMNMKMKLASD